MSSGMLNRFRGSGTTGGQPTGGQPAGPMAPPSPVPPSPSPGYSGLAPWWTGTTDQFFGQQEGLGAAPTEWDIRKVLDKINQNYGNGMGGLNGGVPGNGGGGYIPSPGGEGTPIEGGGYESQVESSTPFLDAYLRAREASKKPGPVTETFAEDK